MGLIKDRNGMDLTEAEDIKKRWKNTQKNYTVRKTRQGVDSGSDHELLITQFRL